MSRRDDQLKNVRRAKQALRDGLRGVKPPPDPELDGVPTVFVRPPEPPEQRLPYKDD